MIPEILLSFVVKLVFVRFSTAIDTRCYKLYYNDVLAQHSRKGINPIITHP